MFKCWERPESGPKVAFYRGNGARQTEGTGLGLFLVKKIIEANRGRIEIDSRKEAGTTFTVSLPAG
jgi:signal transduction histidine kinase